MKSVVMPDPNSLKLLSNNDSKFSVSEPRCAQSIIAVLSAAVSVLKTSNQKWLRYHNYAFPARNHRSRSKKLELTSSVPSSLSTAVRLKSITASFSTVSSPAPATSNPALAWLLTASWMHSAASLPDEDTRVYCVPITVRILSERAVNCKPVWTMGSPLFRIKFLTQKKSVGILILLLRLILVVPGKGWSRQQNEHFWLSLDPKNWHSNFSRQF